MLVVHSPLFAIGPIQRTICKMNSSLPANSKTTPPTTAARVWQPHHGPTTTPRFIKKAAPSLNSGRPSLMCMKVNPKIIMYQYTRRKNDDPYLAPM